MSGNREWNNRKLKTSFQILLSGVPFVHINFTAYVTQILSDNKVKNIAKFELFIKIYETLPYTHSLCLRHIFFIGFL